MTINTTWGSLDSYWVWAFNQEGAEGPCAAGAPNLSLPRRLPGQSYAGFSVNNDPPAGESFLRAHFVLNGSAIDSEAIVTTAPLPECDGAGVGFMSFGAQANRGNGKPIVAINPVSPAPKTVSFTAKLFHVAGTPNYFRLVVMAAWPDAQGRMIPRQIQLNLFVGGRDDVNPALGVANDPVWGDGLMPNRHWNWPLQDDFFPVGGSEIAFVNADSVVLTSCGMNIPMLATMNQQINYSIDIDKLYKCVSAASGFSNALPTTSNIPVYGVHWAVENLSFNKPSAGITKGTIWVSVHNMNTN